MPGIRHYSGLSRATAGLALSLLAALGAVTGACADTASPHYKLYHPDIPPWGSSETGTGFITEIVETAFRKAGVGVETVYAPWKREQAMVQKTPNSFMAPLTRLDHREQLYIWVAPVNISFLQLVTNSDRLAALPVDRLLDMPAIARMESPAEFKLQDLGFSAITIVEDEEAAARLLMANRVAVWMQRGLPGHWAYAKAGGKVEDLKVIEYWRTPLQYLVASHGTDPALVERLRDILMDMQQSGEMDRIKQAHFNFPIPCDMLFSCAPVPAGDSAGTP